jgi:hypothetical protein
MAIPVNKIGRPSGSVPSTPLLMPVACQREVTRVASALAKVSNAWSRTSLAFAWNDSIHALNASRPETSVPALVRTKSSTTRSSTARKSGDGDQTRSQNSETSCSACARLSASSVAYVQEAKPAMTNATT